MTLAVLMYILMLGLSTVSVQWIYDGELIEFKIKGLLQ
jgi:hypothetical protein